MIANVYAGNGYAGLVADMLAELPPNEPLPAACDAAPGGFSPVFDAEATAGLVAQRYSRFCSDAARRWITRDVAGIETRKSRLPWSWECIADFSGCILVSAVEGIHDDYPLRMNDFGFRLKALATLVWLRGRMTPGTSIQALLQQRPEALRSPTRNFRLSADGNALMLPLHHPGAEQPARLPLPGQGARPAPANSRKRSCPN